MGHQKLTPIIATGSSTPRYLGDRFADVVNVKDYGAKGDGTTDDTAAFTAAAATTHYVFVPRGTYKLTEDVSGSFFCFEDVSITGTNGAVNGATTLYGIPADMVDRHGAQTISGVKSFQDEITVKSEEVVHVPNSAAAHNAIYRGKDLTQIYSLADLHDKMVAADFSDLYIGDYLTKPVAISYSGTLDGETVTLSYNDDMNFRIAHFDYWLGMGDSGSGLTSHHIVLVPDKPFGNMKMRKTNTTAGGIPSSNVWTLLQGTIYNALNADTCMNGKILTHRDWIPDSVNTNAASAAGANFVGSTVATSTMWRDVKVGMLHEPMVYGGTHFSSSGYDTGCGKSQLALFALDPTWIHCGPHRSWYWLCAVSSSAYFAYADYTGHADHFPAGAASGGVRPFFLIG